MAKNSIRDYSATNSANTDIQSIDISEGCSPAGINNAIREVMADLKDVSTGAVALESPAADSLTVTGAFTSQGIDDNATSTAMTLDASGNLLVGKAAIGSNINGGEIRADGRILSAVSSNYVGYFNRRTNDGSIIELAKDGTTVGSIGTVTDKIYIGSSAGGDTYLRLNSNTVTPANSSGADRDATINLGYSGGRFSKLFLSGGVYLGGTGAANYLDDYEEGTWTPTIYYQNANDQTNSSNVAQSGVYTKVGNLVTAVCYLKWSALDARANDNIGVTGFPFTPTTSTPDSETRWVAPVFLGSTSYPQGDSQVMAAMYGGGSLATFITANNGSNLGDDLGQNTNMEAKFTITYQTNS